jgi:hypothetical protein
VKKSEMLQEIDEIISKNYQYKNFPEILLARQEELGMVPPFNNDSYLSDWDYADPNSIFYRRWENE